VAASKMILGSFPHGTSRASFQIGITAQPILDFGSQTIRTEKKMAAVYGQIHNSNGAVRQRGLVSLKSNSFTIYLAGPH
jgi:hypothetical protein